MNGPMERSHSGLDIYVMCPRHGWCVWSFNHDGLGWSGDVTLSSRGLLKSIPISSKDVYIVFWFLILKPYMYYSSCIRIIHEN